MTSPLNREELQKQIDNTIRLKHASGVSAPYEAVAIMPLIDQYAQQVAIEARANGVQDLVKVFNKAGDDELNDIRILTNSDSLHKWLEKERKQ